jgi:hypothetical protein
VRTAATILWALLLGGALWPAVARASNVPGEGPIKFIDITEFTATPNPSQVNEAVNFFGAMKTNEGKDELSVSIVFGDGTSDFIQGADIPSSLKGGVPHTYSKAGVFVATVTVQTPMRSASATLYIVVGRGTVVNQTNGMIVTATDINGLPREAAPRYSGGTVNLDIVPSRAGGNSASTDFGDGSATFTGTKAQHKYVGSGLYVATSTGLSGSTPVGKVRKVVNISGKDAGDSGALADPTNASITIKKVQGKVSFSGDKADSLSFSGTVQLPAGFNLARPGGHTLSIGVGNIVDTVAIDEKGKATLPGDKKRITKAKIKWPKTGADIAQIDVTYSLAGLVNLGLDTEGITSTRRSDESNMTTLARQVQVDMLVDGAPYETLIPVKYKLKTDKKTGTAQAGQFDYLPSRAK